jgi:hypothetical protein
MDLAASLFEVGYKSTLAVRPEGSTHGYGQQFAAGGSIIAGKVARFQHSPAF